MDALDRKEKERQVRETEMIDAAQKLFCEMGFEHASMEKIALEAQFTKRTIYQYFENKDDLFYAVINRGFAALVATMDVENRGGISGFERIENGTWAYYAFFRENTDLFRLMNYTGFVNRRSEKVTKHRKNFVQLNRTIFEGTAATIEQGKTDGSINPQLDSLSTAYSLIFMVTGFFNQLAVSGESFTKSFSIDLEEFVHNSMDLMLKDIKRTH